MFDDGDGKRKSPCKSCISGSLKIQQVALRGMNSLLHRCQLQHVRLSTVIPRTSSRIHLVSVVAIKFLLVPAPLVGRTGWRGNSWKPFHCSLQANDMIAMFNSLNDIKSVEF
ncbi:hypothetical protein PM082_012236 [Marasmius tenuissimus]|nr:hypothetical protein PM082_012236 [Marasmius tenuissimus]